MLDAAALAGRDASGDLVVLDEAQAIKNPGARQTRAVKAARRARADRADRHAGGKPARRPVVDLRFPQPGPARRRARQFARFTKRSTAQPAATFGPLRELVRPYILRRLKTDRRVIADLPDKTEVQGVLRPVAAPGGAVRAGRATSWPRRLKTPTASSAAASCWRS